MYEDITPESIKKSILDTLPEDIDRREGSYTNDLIAPTALELWKFYDSLNAAIPIFYIDETSGKYIERRCEEIGLIPKDGTKAAVTLTFSGDDGTIIPAGSAFLTTDGLIFLTDASATIVGGAASAPATADKIGAAYNVPAGSVTVQYRSLMGLRSVTNAEAALGGSDAESPASLVARYYAARRRPAVSGNKYQYEQLALETEGVGGVKVLPLAYGPGTIDIVITGTDMGPVPLETVDACAAHIEMGRTIGAEVTVESVQGVILDVAATVALGPGAALAAVREAFAARLTAWIRETVKAYQESDTTADYRVPYTQIAYLLMGTDGVADYEGLTVNGGTAAVTLNVRQAPVIGTVVLTEWL